MSLSDEMVPEGPEITYSDGFKQMIEDHLTYLKMDKQTQTMFVNNDIAYKSNGDLVSVLQEYDIPAYQHWIIMRMNGYTSPMEYLESHITLIIPSTVTLDKLISVYRVNQTIV